ncbi:hypothetical protein ACIQ4I_10365 [Rummeliibacillus sp. NPDC094406]|uniref:hypothetical protein n=1 Tax=Rummeliibacillus sp. NPDC094406 TaxID=3364511 RepID=UPI0038195BC7
MTYAEVGALNGLTADAVENDARYIRKFIPGFAEDGFKIRELAYYQCYRAEFTEENKQIKREQGIRAMMLAIKQDIVENMPYANLALFI